MKKDKDILYPGSCYKTTDRDKVDQPFFMRQTIGNACGTVALLHALCNNEGRETNFVKDSFLDTFVSRFRNATPLERADFLYEDVLVETSH